MTKPVAHDSFTENANKVSLQPNRLQSNFNRKAAGDTLTAQADGPE